MNVLETDSVLLNFGEKRVLQDVFLRCETGKITGLLGLNGSGKSCLLNILFGQLLPNDHSVRINGIVLPRKARSPRDIRYLPQFHFIPKPLRLKRVFKDFKLDFGNFLSSFPEFRKFKNSRLSQLSGGERRIVEIYAILCSDSKFCLLDEPFSQVMPVHVETLKQLIVNQKVNKGIIITDHLYEHITEISDNLYLIQNGKTVPVNGTDDLKLLGYC